MPHEGIDRNDQAQAEGGEYSHGIKEELHGGDGQEVGDAQTQAGDDRIVEQNAVAHNGQDAEG